MTQDLSLEEWKYIQFLVQRENDAALARINSETIGKRYTTKQYAKDRNTRLLTVKILEKLG